MSNQASPVTTTEPLIPPFLPSGPSIPNDDVRAKDRLISRRELSTWFRISVQRLGSWARTGHGPKPIRIGGYKVFYQLSECLAYLRARPADTTPDVRKIPKRKSETLSSAI